MFAAMWQRSFLYRIFLQDKTLFVVFVLFIAGQLYFTSKRVENTPFFHYGMYSAIHPQRDQYTVYSIKIDDAPVLSQAFFDYQREVVYNTISGYDKLSSHGFRDELEQVTHSRLSSSYEAKADALLLNTTAMDTPYRKWLLHYIADMRMVHNPEVVVMKNHVAYNNTNGALICDSPSLLFKWRDE